MKRLSLTSLASLCFFIVVAQEKILKEMDATKVSKADVPGSVVQKAEKDLPNASPFQFYNVGETSVSADWKISENVNFNEGEKINHYVVEMKGKDSYYHALYDANGKLLMSREMQKDVALPRPVMGALGKAYPDVTLKKKMSTPKLSTMVVKLNTTG